MILVANNGVKVEHKNDFYILIGHGVDVCKIHEMFTVEPFEKIVIDIVKNMDKIVTNNITGYFKYQHPLKDDLTMVKVISEGSKNHEPDYVTGLYKFLNQEEINFIFRVLIASYRIHEDKLLEDEQEKGRKKLVELFKN